MERIPKREGLRPPQIETTPTGTIVEELRPGAKEILPIEASPMLQINAARLIVPPRPPPIAGVRESENPFATPYGPQLDVVEIRNFLERAERGAGKQIDALLESSPNTVAPDRLRLMKGSRGLEKKMASKLQSVLSMMLHVRSQMAATREG